MAPLSLSKSWRVIGTHTDCYTGGRVRLSSCKTLVACWCNESVKLVRLADGHVVASFEDDNDAFIAFDLHPSAPELATVQRSGLIRIWSLETRERLREWKGHKLPVTCIAYDSTGNLLATGAVDRQVRIWNATKGFATHTYAAHNDVITCLTFHPNPSALVVYSGARDGSIVAYDLRKQTDTSLSNHMATVTDLAVDADSERLLSVGRDKVINVWAADTLTLLRTIPVLEELEGIAWLPDSCALPVAISSSSSKRFMTVGQRGLPAVYTLDDMRCVYADETTAQDDAIALTGVLVRDDDFIVVSSDHNLHVRDLATFAQTNCIIGYNDEILDIQCLPDSERAAVATNSQLIRIIDLGTFNARLLSGHTAVVLAVSVSPCGTFLASASKDNTLRVWDLRTFACTAVVQGHTRDVSACTWGRAGALYSASADRTLKRWQVDLQGGTVRPDALATVLAHDADVNAVAVSPNDKLVATCSQDKTVKIWETSDLAPVATLRGHRRGVWCMAFSPVDKCLATGSGDRTIRIWSLRDNTCVRTLQGHTGSVLRLLFLPGGMQILSAGADALVKLWTVHTNECTATFEDAHDDGKIWAMALTPDHARLVTGATDSKINVWRDFTLDDAEEERRAADERTLADQALQNAMKARDHVNAAALAVRLRNPRRLYTILEACPDGDLDAIVDALTDDDLGEALSWIRDWNTVAKRCIVGQRLLRVICRRARPERLLGVKGAGAVLDALAAYSQRHFDRIDRLVRKTFLMDYVLKAQGALGDPAAAEPNNNGAIESALGKRGPDDDNDDRAPASRKTKKKKQQQATKANAADLLPINSGN
ncbi:U3 small nucleolar RNA-associated protein 13 C-terminal domain-containing protein [Plasmodiophora brassicae]|uniref:U3 small nucleolar RNA-associated protein 13 C-terminal domain-containing protein n=1 Tax=Plasmodiophora brassicae TaxID=37360 RepID=A0A0G4J2X6_PLABS|nr:hypothetical protein PBRA_008820 [Plasmodiophora brassicae]SPQ96554.1 unnamed protein product [Plasmodiophora brassicae]